MTLDDRTRAALCRIARRMDARGYVGATDGNVSARVDDDHFVISRSGVAFADLDPQDLVVIDHEGRPVVEGAPRPSSEFRMHARIYRARPDVNAVAHAHPPTAIAFTVSGRPWTDGVFPEVIAHLETVPVLPYTLPTTDETANAVEAAIANRDALILAHHGVVAVGTSPDDAYLKLDKVEHTAKILWIAETLGGVTPLSEQEQQRVRETLG